MTALHTLSQPPYSLPQGKLVVESNVYQNNTLTSAGRFGPDACLADAAGCVMWKQNPPSLLDSLIKMFMEPGSARPLPASRLTSVLFDQSLPSAGAVKPQST
jgi:hypothetical protein